MFPDVGDRPGQHELVPAMQMRRVAIAALLLACAAHRPVVAIAAAAPVCRPASDFGASASSPDNRAAFQAALDAGCLDLRDAPGRYVVRTPSVLKPGPIDVLTMPVGSTILGDTGELIAFVGDPQFHDWHGVRPLGSNRIDGVRLAVEEPGGSWQEQSPIVWLNGPLRGFELSNFSLSHPLVAGSRRGDCIQIRGYAPDASGAGDRRVWDVEIHHGVFSASSRSSIAMRGVHGHQLPDGHSTARIHHTASYDTADQDLDQEGTGDNGGIDESDVVEWDHNIHRVGPSHQSTLAISLYPGRTHLHHNIVDRGVDIMGGSHELDHNLVTQGLPNGGDAVLAVRKAGSTVVHDDTYVRMPEAGAGQVVVLAQRITSPTVTMTNVRLVQHTAATAVVITGVSGVVLRAVDLLDDGPAAARDAVRIEGAEGRTGPVTIADGRFVGPFSAVLSVSGAYAGGVGSLTITDNFQLGAVAGLRCENVVPAKMRDGRMSGGISGPLLYEHNLLPTPSCTWPATATLRH